MEKRHSIVELLETTPEFYFTKSYSEDCLSIDIMYDDEITIDSYIPLRITKTIPDKSDNLGQDQAFIDTSKFEEDLIDWLEKNDYGERTGEQYTIDNVTYPVFEFYGV